MLGENVVHATISPCLRMLSDIHASVVLPVRCTYKCGVICPVYIQVWWAVRCTYKCDVTCWTYIWTYIQMQCYLLVVCCTTSVALPVRHTGMGIVCKNINFHCSETDFLRREKTFHREKKLGVQKTKSNKSKKTRGSADFSSTHVAVLDCIHRRT